MILSLKSTTPAALAALLLLFTSCSSTPPPEAAVESSILLQNADGATLVDTLTVTGAVKAVDPAARKVTLQFADGSTHTYTAPPDAVNFDRIKVGDLVKAAVTEEFAVSLRKAGTPASVGGATAVALAPKGAMPGGVVANTVEVTATITAVNVEKRRVTLQFADGTTRTIRVGQQVDLAQVKAGDAVQTQMSESLALSVEAP